MCVLFWYVCEGSVYLWWVWVVFVLFCDVVWIDVFFVVWVGCVCVDWSVDDIVCVWCVGWFLWLCVWLVFGKGIVGFDVWSDGD